LCSGLVVFLPLYCSLGLETLFASSLPLPSRRGRKGEHTRPAYAPQTGGGLGSVR
jgi:hypothetical protein